MDHLVPRAPDDDKHVGSAGRVKKRHHVPLSKGYFEGYNLKVRLACCPLMSLRGDCELWLLVLVG